MIKVFVYNRRYYVDGVPVVSRLYLGGLDSSKPEEVLEQYLIWYNKDFRFNGYPGKELPFISSEDFEFVESFCPIDFSCELQNEKFR